MKKMFFLLLIIAPQLHAQYYDTRNHVLNHSMERQAIPTDQKKDKPDVVQLSLDKLTAELSLDSFQQAVVKQLLTDNMQKEEQVLSQDIPDESKREQIMALRDKLEQKMKEILTDDQQKKLIALKDNRKEKKKK